jgi:DNA-binding HxlR family transcriptional regulator
MPDEQKIMYSTEGMKACPVDTTSKIIGKKYTVLLIRNMLSNHKRFNQFLESIEGMNQKILSTRLKEMEREGLVTRRVYAEMPLRVEFFLQKKGWRLSQFSIRWLLFLFNTALKTYLKMESPGPCKMSYTNR